MSSVGAGSMGGAVGAGARRAGPKLADLKDSSALRHRCFPPKSCCWEKNRDLVVSGSMVNNDASWWAFLRNFPLTYIEICRAHCSVEDVSFAIRIFKPALRYPRCTNFYMSYTGPFTQINIYIILYIYLHPGFPSHMDDFCWLASTSTLPSSFSGTSFDTSSVSCASASSLKRALRQPMRLAGQLRLGCVSDRGLTMLMKVLCTWPNACLFVPLLFGPPGRFRRLRCHAVWKVVS